MFLARRISLIRTVVYIICQLAGAIVGSALVRAVDPSGFKAALGAANRLNSWADVGTGLGAELILTAIFVFVVFAAVDQTRGAHSAHVPALAPLAIGIVVFLCHIVAVPIDGCSVNPARSFGAAVVARTWQHHWIFWVGPIVGGAAAGLLYEALAYRAPLFGGPVEKQNREPGTSPAGPQEYTA
jgi:aquaporin PIP